MNPQVFGRNVQSFRKLLGMSIRDLAARSGLSTRTIVKIEAGKGCTSLSEKKIAAGLSVYVGRLWEENSASGDHELHISRQEGRWFFLHGEDATTYHHRKQRIGDSAGRVRSDPDEIQDEAERSRLGRAGLSRGFIRTCGRAIAAGFFLLNEGEVYAFDRTPPATTSFPYLLICTAGALRFSIRGKDHILKTGDSIVYEELNETLDIEPWPSPSECDLPCRFYLTCLKVLDPPSGV